MGLNTGWISIREVEYSTSLKFFSENQVLIVKTLNNKITLNSRLEKFCFYSGDGSGLSDGELIKSVHLSLIKGVYS